MAISKVVVVDGNNLTVRIDRGVAGRGITDVQPIEIDNALYLEFFFSDGTTETVGPVGTIQYIGQAPIVVNASTISLSTVPVNLGGTGQVTANAGFNALAPSQTSNAGKYLKTDGTNAAWDVLDISTADITGVLPIANGGTNASTAAGARTNLNAANQDTTISAGTGLSGGGSLAADRTLSIANTAVTAASYGAASKTLTATVNAQGQLTALADTPIAIANTQISGLGTMSTQNANAVAITGGSITGITDLAVADGGTGASTAADARTNLNAANQDTTISAGTGLSGGGSLAANRTLSIANTGVTAGSFGSASSTLSATVNAQGQLTSLAATPIAIANTQVSGLGTASTLNAGVALGVATLDAGGTVPLSQIPASIQGGVSYQGSWNAATNTPTIVSSIGTKGHYYVVSVAGSTNINGITDWLPGDWIIFNGSVWEQIDNTDTVQSVNGYVGAVVLTAADVGAPPTTRTITAGTGLSGGGDLSANLTMNIANTAVTAGSYGTASSVPSITVNAQGQLTAAANTTIAIANTQVSGLGTMSTQNANSVAITGGTITGGTINGTTIGGTTAAAGAFTTLSASGAVTLSGATANGVVYANGSKVLTTGSALTFDGSEVFKNSGGTIQYNDIRGSAAAGTRMSAGGTLGTDSFDLFQNSSAGYVYNRANTPLIFGINNAEQMRLTSTGLGIGTSSPGSRLEVNGNARLKVASGNVGFNWQSGLTDYAAYLNVADNSLRFYSSVGVAGDKLILDAPGNLGLGVTPSAWSSARVMQVGLYGNISTLNNSTYIGQNFYFDGSFRYQNATSRSACLYEQNQFNGIHAWYTSAAGTAGDAISFSQVMTLTAAGDLGIGTSSPGSILDVVGSGNPTLTLRGSAGAYTSLLKLQAAGGGGSVINATGASTDTLTFQITDSEQMRLTSTGLGIGTSSPIDFAQYGYGPTVEAFGGRGGSFVTTSSSSTVRGVFAADSSGSVVNLKTVTNHALAFGVNDAEQMRLTSTGLGIGTSSPGAKLHVAVATATGTSGADGVRVNAGGTVAINMGADSSSGYGWIQSANWGNGYISTVINPNGGNVGIGTSSPTQSKLHVKQTANSQGIRIESNVNDTQLSIYNSNSEPEWRFTASYGSTGSFQPITFWTSDTKRLTLDSSGNLGLGVTPSAWNSSRRALQIGQSTALYSFSTSQSILGTNVYMDSGGTDRYLNSAAATQYVQSGGVHSWNIAPSGTAGNAISFSQAMTLDASGNLGVGTSSPSTRLEVNAASDGEYFRAGGGTISERSLRFSNFTVSGLAGVGHQINVPNANGVLTFATGSTERARIDSSGNLIQTVNTTAATLATNNTLTFSIVDNSTLRISVRGSDGTTRTATVALT